MLFFFIHLAVGLLLIGCGLAVHKFKKYWLIAGYNTMSKEEREKVDAAGLGRLVGIYLYLNGAVFILAGILEASGVRHGMTAALIFMAVSTVFVLIKAQKYNKNLFDEDGNLRQGAGKKAVLPVVITIITFIVVGILLVFSSKETKVTILDEGIQIHGMYGEVYEWDDIKSIELKEELPTIEVRTNGSAVGANLKGYFRTTEYGKVKLFVNADTPPFIYLDTDERLVIFNRKNAEQTKEIYEKITAEKEANR